MPMPQKIPQLLPSEIDAYRKIRRDLHAHPELGFEEHRTAEVVCAELRRLSIEHRTGVGGTGVVGMIQGRGTASGRAIGLRADMDALPMDECTRLDYASRHAGRMHACGHDGHVAMLLAAAAYLQRTRAFDGVVYLIFQPAEEGLNGGLEMIRDGLFERFPMQEVYALHNWPALALGSVSVPVGPAMAASDRITIRIKGKGGHGGLAPQRALDPILMAGHVIVAAHSIVSRNLDPLEAGVLSLCGIAGGSLAGFNVIPDEVVLTGTARSLQPEVRSIIETRLRATVEHVVQGLGGTATLEYEPNVPATVNTEAQALLARRAAADVVGEDNVVRRPLPSLGGEDFSFMLQQRPGAYIHLGTGDPDHRHGLHNSNFDFNDAALPIGAAVLSRIAELGLPLHNNA